MKMCLRVSDSQRRTRVAIARGRIAATFVMLAAQAVALASEPAIRAQLSPRDSTTLSSQLAGKLAVVHVREGDRFKQGQKLAEFDCALHRAHLDKAKAVEAEAHKTYEVNQRLDTLKSVSMLEVEVAAARLAAARAERNVAQILTDRCVILAPFPGRVAASNVRSHQYVPEGERLFEILDDRTLETETIVPSRWLSWLKPGGTFQITIDETGRTYSAEVTRVGARIDPVSQTVAVFGQVKAPAGELLAGMSGRALFKPAE